jgi:DASH complex subunit ASK1
MADTPRRTIPPNPQRWKPAEDPSTIVIPGLDTDASTTDQIEQIEQLITIKLQVRFGKFSTIYSISKY